MKILYLLRHGQSRANSMHLVNGTLDDPLTDYGRAQVSAAATLIPLYRLAFTHCFVSQWRRAQETAALFLPNERFTVDPRLGETDPGCVHHITFAELLERYPEFKRPFDPNRPYPGGETHQQLYERSVAWFTETMNAAPEGSQVLAVTHAGPITSIIQHVCKVSMADFPQFVPHNATLSKLVLTDDGPWKLEFFGLLPATGLAL